MRNRTCSRFAAYAGLTLTLLVPAAAAAATGTPPNPLPKCTDGAPPCAAPSAAPLHPAAKIDPDALLLLSVQLDKLTLTDGLGAYGDLADPLIPFGEFTRLLEYDVEVDPSERRIVGRLGEARTSLTVDLATGTARVGAKQISLGPEDVSVSPSEIYLRVSAVQRLLPLKIAIDQPGLALMVMPQALLPVQSRLERLARQRQPAGGPQFQDEVLKVPSPYRLYSMPSFDVTASAGVSSGQSQGPKTPLRYDIRAGADLFHAGLQAYVGSDEVGKPSVARFLLERRSLDGQLLGPLHARVVSLGDVYTPGMTLGPRSVGGRGVAFSTVPLDETNIFNRIDLRGELPIGYDVELYVNDVLQGGQNTPNKGRYEFLNVPLSRGVNVVRIVTYGPHGERNEQTRIINVGGGQLRRGQATFEFGAVQQERPILDLRQNDGDFVSTGAGGLRVVAAATYGLTDLVTLAGGASLIPVTGGGSRGLLTIGARTSLFGFLTQLDVGADSAGGAGESVGLAGQLFGVSTVARYVRLQSGFLDENGPSVDFTRPLTSRGEVSFDGNAQLFSQVVPLSLRFARTTYADGATELSGSARGSATVAAALLSGGFEYARATGSSGDGRDRLTGFLAASTYRSFKWQLRGTIDYDILPEAKPRALAITLDRDISERTSLRLGIGESLEEFDRFNLEASANVRTSRGDLALTSSYNNADRSWRLGAQVAFGAAYDATQGRYQITRGGPGTGGSVAFHAFYDNNGNGRWDPGEPGVPDVVVEGGERRATTSADGRVLVTGLGASPTARLNINLERVDAASLKSPPQLIQISPRAGQVTQVEFPLQPTSEVLIRIFLVRPDGSKVGLSGVHARLVGENGREVEATTEFDGSASFQELTSGSYQLLLDEDQARRLRMHLVSPLTVTIRTDGFTPDAAAEVQFDPRPAEQDPGQS